MAARCAAAQTMMRSAPLALVVASVAEAADERRVFGIPAVLDPGPEVAHKIAASRTWVHDRSCLTPVLVPMPGGGVAGSATL